VKEAWSGRTDSHGGPAGFRWHQVMNFGSTEAENAINLLGFACDEGVRRNRGRVGAAEGPKALRGALSNLAIHKQLTLHDLGDVQCISGDLESAQNDYAELAAAALRQKQFVVGLGGGHEIAYASFLGLHRANPVGLIGMINFDAHLDLRSDEPRNSGTGFLDALRTDDATSYLVCGINPASNTQALYQTAKKYNVVVIEDDFERSSTQAIGEFLESVAHVYLSLDLDVFPAAVAPGVSAPAALGIDPLSVMRCIRFVAASGKLRIFDVAELNPSLDHDHKTAKLGARMIYEVVNHLP
jgi:formiminoglutamase